MEELGLVSDVALAEWNGGVIEFLAGELGTAAMHLEIASRAFEGRGERGRSSRAGLALAEAYYALGRFEDALAWTQFAERTGTPDDVEIMVRSASYGQGSWPGGVGWRTRRVGDERL